MKRAVLPSLLIICVSMSAHLSAQNGVVPLSPGMTENQIFDTIRQPPIDLLRQLYEDHQLLVLSFSEHDNERQYQALAALLDQVGHDPRLRYIVLERLAETAPALEVASVRSLDEMQLKQQVMQPLKNGPSPFMLNEPYSALCRSEWAFTWAEVLPRIRAINAGRPATQQLLVTGVDGVVASVLADRGLKSYERDSTTAALFDRRIWQELKRDTTAKAIVVYNIYHTMYDFKVAGEGRVTPSNFLGMFLQGHPEAKPRTALGLIEGSHYSDVTTYELRFTERQVMRAPDRPFGVRTAPFRGIAAERGDSLFTSSAAWGPSDVENTAILPEIVDAIVWLPKADRPTKQGNKYFPKACAL